MGCLFSRFCSGQTPLEEQDEPPKSYSWDKREKINVKDFTIENVKEETVGRVPGTINGQQFIINNCEKANIYLLDHTASVSIDDCTDCNIFIGPCKTSVFIRDCKQCNVVVACQQFRTRDCQRITTFMSCVTQPIIESSIGMKFGCFQYFYPELEGQFRSAGLSIFNNNWSNIHDFTPVPGENNFSLLPEEAKVDDYLPLPTTTPQFASMQISTDFASSVVPLTLGSRRKKSHESCLIVFFNDGGSHDRAVQFISKMKKDHSSYDLVQTKEVTMHPDHTRKVFATDSYQPVVLQGPVIGLEYNGDGSLGVCQREVVDLTKGTTGLVYVSQNRDTAPQQIEDFYNFADMQMQI